MRYIDRVIKSTPVGTVLRLRLTSLDDEGAGVGEAGGRRVHVAQALPGDLVDARVEHESPHGPDAWARLVCLVEQSADRVTPACEAFGRCGGCVLQHLDYARQTDWKRDRLMAALAAAGITAPVRACVASPTLLAWRNNSKLVFARGEQGRVILGAYAPRSHDVIDLSGCLVGEPPLASIGAILGQEATRLGIVPYDEATATGEVRYALARRNARGEVLVMLVVPVAGAPRIAELAAVLRRAVPEVVGVVENVQPSRGNALVGHVAPDRVLEGAAFLDEQVGGVRMRLSPRAFFQSNRDVAERLYADVAAAAALGPGDRAVDVYSGVGGIALTLARDGAEVLGIEVNPEAVVDARAAAVANGARARFVAGDAAALLAAEAHPDMRAGGPLAALVVDPPRKGCDAAVLEACATLAPRRLLYVSCDPTTLARDLRILDERGYRTLRVTPYDMMPHTPHIEALAELAPR